MNTLAEKLAPTFEIVPCNWCGTRAGVRIGSKNHRGLRLSAELCMRCGLIRLNPRPSKDGYRWYYNNMYRVDRTEATGGDVNEIGNLFETSSHYGSAIGSLLKPYVSQGLILDVGSSTGGVLTGIKKVLPRVSVRGIEPSPDEARYAETRGIPTTVSLFEDFTGMLPERPAAIVCTQSLNHLLDPKGFLERAHALLIDGGYLLLAVKNFRHQASRAGGAAAAIQVDHPFMFTPEVLKRFVEQSGFTVVYFDVDERKTKKEIDIQRREGLTKGHVRLIAKQSLKPARVSYPQWLARMKLRLQFLPFVVKIVYLVKHSQRFSFLR